jgi:hypothetical protein
VRGTTSPAGGYWPNTTLTDIMEQTPATWMDNAVPGWRDRTYSDYLMRTTPAEWWSMMYPTLAGSTRRQSHQRHSPHHHGRDCGCRGRDHDHACGCHDCAPAPCECDDCKCHDCARAPCECDCCIGDVDITVYTRVGEERVVPIMIENEWRRERSIKLELSKWTTRAGNPAPVETVQLEPTEFTLEPCGRKEVTLVIKVSAPAPVKGEKAEPGEEHRDVDACLVVTSDLRLEGCEHRPVRIAAAILPRYCDPCRVACGCGCC